MDPQVDLMCGVRLPGVEDRPERVIPGRRHHDVHVIWHHAPRVQEVSLGPEEKESLLDDACQSGESQEGVGRISKRL